MPAPQSPDRLVVLIDDDALVRMNWKMVALTKGINLKIFSGPADFLAAAEGLPISTAIYLDSDLGIGIRGEDFAKDLKEKGFFYLHLETGHPAGAFSHLPWLKVAGKEPPWN